MRPAAAYPAETPAARPGDGAGPWPPLRRGRLGAVPPAQLPGAHPGEADGRERAPGLPRASVVAESEAGLRLLRILAETGLPLLAASRDPESNDLLELQASAAARLPWPVARAFLGAAPMPRRMREDTYLRLRADLTHRARGRWDARGGAIRRGVLDPGAAAPPAPPVGGLVRALPRLTVVDMDPVDLLRSLPAGSVAGFVLAERDRAGASGRDRLLAEAARTAAAGARVWLAESTAPEHAAAGWTAGELAP